MCNDHAALPLDPAPSWPSSSEDAGFHRMRLGRMTITTLCDGWFSLSAHDVLRGGRQPLQATLARARLGCMVTSHVNAFVIEDGEHVVLVDTGAGALQDATLGGMSTQLAAAGLRPADIDTVLLTHLHPDHMGGLTRNGVAVFPRAIVHVARAEAAFWLHGEPRAEVDASVQASFGAARLILSPYMAEGRIRWFDPDASWHGSLSAESLPGHTVGHTGFRLQTGEADMVFCGDLFHVASAQMADPSITVCYDSEPAQASTTRAAFLAKASRRGYFVAAAHAPFPGLGRIAVDHDGYAWKPEA